MVSSIEISASGLVAQRLRMNTIATNIANVSTTRNEAGEAEPFVRKRVIFQVGIPGQDASEGVHVSSVEDDVPGESPTAAPFRLAYEPNHPDANDEGYVRYPNVDLAREFVNALEASRAYEANIQAIEVFKAMGSNVSRLLE
ncbi:Flagellar basal-body rod protein FlgC [Planctomycetes bacterium Pan216]|uniref:Flagellar basal-body rod protein FlgC n=1 Tax=Kolteria novifilia TaxID=2527975 RepID=A0A518B531_9BACT|nr:Flagellar basal-body rod protein FlgC [Planctomycetes bacterium Pan216]